ncbi:formylglycine-generating enzyme family protein [Kaarinaea lacus]
MRFILLLLSVTPWLVCAADFPDSDLSVGAAATLAVNAKTKDECIACHAAVDHDAEKLQVDLATQKCQRCHGEQTHIQPDVIVAQAAPGQSAGSAKPKKRIPPNYGMQFPLYYAQSRLGDAPNKMVLIPAGEFIRGTNDRLPDEGPQHVVKLQAFYIDIFEVTNLQYKKFNDATKRRSPTHFRNRTFPDGKADHPVTYVSWEDADAYCKWAGKRLPSDKEWEKAARGSDGRWYPWGETFDIKKANTPLRWREIGVFGDTTPVGSFAEGVSPYGVYDMSGNVWEWTASWYQAYPNNKVASESYGERYKTLKGGSWFDCSFYNCGISAPVFNRAFFAIRTKNDSFGFRCAKDVDK